jgi:hypothetical protein
MADDLKSSASIWDEGNTRRDQTQSAPNLIDTQPAEEPPSYTNATTSVTTPSRPQRPATPPRQRYNPIEALSLLSSIRFQSYPIPNSTIDPKRTVTTTTYAPFYSSPSSLTKLLIEQSNLPPRPLIRIRGTHVNSSTQTVVDFDLVLNLTTLLDLQSPRQASDESSSNTQAPARIHFKELPIDTQSSSSGGSRLFRREKDRPETSPLTKWATKFTTDKSENKSFYLMRVIPHAIPLQQTLEGSIRTLLHTLQYRGKVEVTFPTQYESIIVQKKPGNWFVSMLNLHPEKKYDVLESHFQFRGHPVAPSSEDGNDALSPQQGKAHMKAAEANARSLAEEWWNDWREVVRNGVLRGSKGRLGVEEWIEMSMGRRIGDRGREWGVDGSWDGSGPVAWPGKWTEEDF